MLTSDLVRVTFRRGEVVPQYVKPDDPDLLSLAESLLGIFQSHIGAPRFELEDELDEFLGTGTAFLLHRGLAKLLFDRCEFETSAKADPAHLRRSVFEAAAQAYRGGSLTAVDRTAVIAPLLSKFGLDPEGFEHNLYADLKSHDFLKAMEPCGPDWLLARYNVALAQAVLFRATDLTIQVQNQSPALYREIFRKLKFFQLLYQLEGTEGGGYRIRLDGPFSLFKSSQRYGLQMANFLPALLHCSDWQLEAKVSWGKQRWEKVFRLSSEMGLQPYTRLTGQWQPQEMTWLLDQFPKLESHWTISAEGMIKDLGGQGILLPDYVFTHRVTGQQVFMEIFGFWRRGAVSSRLDLLRQCGVTNCIVAVGADLHVDEEKTADFPGEVYVFRSVPVAREVLALLEKFEKT